MVQYKNQMKKKYETPTIKTRKPKTFCCFLNTRGQKAPFKSSIFSTLQKADLCGSSQAYPGREF